VIYASAKGRQRVEEHGISAIAGSAVASLALGAFVVWERGMLADYAPTGLLLLLAAFTLAGAIIGWTLVQLLRQHVDATSLARFTGTILPNETMVVAEVEAGEASRVLAILRGVEAEAPVTFGFYPPPPFSVEPTGRPLGHEFPSGQRLVENAAHLAHAIVVGRGAKPRGPSFLRRLREIEHALEWANASLTMSAEAHHAFTLSAEWLLDNAYLIREQVTDLRESLPQKQYGKLPLIASSPEAGMPRVYHVASEIVAESGGALEPEFIGKFLKETKASLYIATKLGRFSPPGWPANFTRDGVRRHRHFSAAVARALAADAADPVGSARAGGGEGRAASGLGSQCAERPDYRHCRISHRP